MLPDVEFPLPDRPKLRAVEPAWVTYEGEPRLWLRDHLRLTEQIALIPRALVPLLAALDGTRDLASLGRVYAEQTGILLPETALVSVLMALDNALLLESPRLRRAKGHATQAFRSQPWRPAALATTSYPSAPDALDAYLAGFALRAPSAGPDCAPLAPRLTLPSLEPMRPIARASGVLSPHIDFHRGGPVYAATWQAAADALTSAEVVVLFGTDHHGSAGRLTTTLQRYATPWGVLPTEDETVRAVAAAIGEDALGEEIAFDEELHHAREHSIELAAVWVHWILARAGVTPPTVVPILCGSFHPFTRPAAGNPPTHAADPLPEDEPRAAAALDALVAALDGRRAFVVSAADLAHVGPSFGDAAPLSSDEKTALAAADEALLRVAALGDATAFLAHLRSEADQRRVCGLPPTYWAMRVLERLAGSVRGRLAGYDVCSADPDAGSVVTIAGLLWEETPAAPTVVPVDR